jgi:LysM repeat protein
MKRVHRAWITGTIGLLIVLVLAAGCYRPVTTPAAAPTAASVEETSIPSDEEVIATAKAEATRAAQTAVAQAAEGDDEPTDVALTEEPAASEPAEPADEPDPTDEPEPTAVPTAVEEQPTAAPSPEPTAAPQPTSTTGGTVHVVQAGETAYRIAVNYGVTVAALVAANNLADATKIYVGQKLIIPASGTQPPAATGDATTYVVKAGDNLYRIALAFGITYQQLALHNGISDPNDIVVGQVLRIPAR